MSARRPRWSTVHFLAGFGGSLFLIAPLGELYLGMCSDTGVYWSFTVAALVGFIFAWEHPEKN